jgi:hexokinase
VQELWGFCIRWRRIHKVSSLGRTVVAMDGGLYEHYPQYRRYLQDVVTKLLGLETSKNVIIEHSKDGYGIGAAFLAATNSKYEHDF